ncbi:MAG: ornithine cyclodeaminase family protein [Planctomycetota bacterium]|nr:ornithine cyclodeaminase family protein [Planctomycetota bacterium]
MKLLNKSDILKLLKDTPNSQLIECIEQSFLAYSDGKAKVPPVGHLGFDSPPGDVHIKYGYIEGDSHYVIKIASGFYENPAKGLPASHGMMLSFDAKTGQPSCILLDEGYLTDLRTGLAGAVAAKHLANESITRIGIIGAGVQARFQLKSLAYVRECRDVLVYNRSADNAYKFRDEMNESGFHVEVSPSIKKLAKECDLIVTTTPSVKPLLYAKHVRPGTHISAVGADALGKQELDVQLFNKADLLICDSLAQCMDHGEITHGIQAGVIGANDCEEMGQWLRRDFNRAQDMITIADLTGIATQDIGISKLVLNAAEQSDDQS